MDPTAMEPFGLALQAFFEGDASTELIVRRGDGEVFPLRVSLFCRELSGFTSIDRAALECCTGHVLDVGAGAGPHSLVLQQRGFQVTAIDVSPRAVEIMKKRGVMDARCADIFQFSDGAFDTLLMMGHGIGMVETIDGLDRFLAHAHTITSRDGQVLFDSLDVRNTDNPKHLSYLEANRQAGRYMGEIRLRFEFRGKRGPYCGWLHVDADTLKSHAEEAGWRREVILQEESGDYLARLRKDDQ